MVCKFDCVWNNFNVFSLKSGPEKIGTGNIGISRDICYQINPNTKRKLHVQLSLCFHVQSKSYQPNCRARKITWEKNIFKEWTNMKDEVNFVYIALENIKVNHLLLQVAEANLKDGKLAPRWFFLKNWKKLYGLFL